MNILIIEDDKLTYHSLKHALENLDHKVMIAENAPEAISKIEKNKFDIIFSDMMMPGVSGLSLLKTLRTLHNVKTPVIAMSVLTDKPLVDAAFNAGSNDFMAKPFTLEDLNRKLQKVNDNNASNGINTRNQ